MRADDRILARKKLDKRLNPLRNSQAFTRPPRGWLKAIREALGITSAQLGKRMGVSQPRILEIEKSEKSGSITLDTLERAANEMDCKLVYALVPKDPLEHVVECRALAMAKKQMTITSHNMALEAQSILVDDEKEQLEIMVRKIIENAGSNLWSDDV